MNERILQLAAQCHHSYSQHNIDLAKFAELIVMECADVGAQWAEGLIDTERYAFVNKKIKQHFGD
jgi:hypothetical protein